MVLNSPFFKKKEKKISKFSVWVQKKLKNFKENSYLGFVGCKTQVKIFSNSSNFFLKSWGSHGGYRCSNIEAQKRCIWKQHTKKFLF